MSTLLFFYGTLCHAPLLALVLGRAVGQGVQPARLPGYRATWVQDQPFPMIAEAPGAVAQGVLVSDLTEAEIDRLDYYEGGFAYDLHPVAVQTSEGEASAQVYLPQPGLWTPGAAWDLAHWVRDHGALTLCAATEVMERYGKTPVSELRALFPFIRARAWARHLASVGVPQDLRCGRTKEDVEHLRDRPGYDGFFRIKAFDLRFRRFDGGWSDPVGREAFVAFDAALVLPYDPVTDQVLLIEQLRFGPIQRGDPFPWVLEPIAGLVDAGEDPADCARREALEEAGIQLADLHPMVRVYASPGYSTEFFHCFLGLCDLSGYATGVAGLASENEDIRSHVIPFDQAMTLVDNGEVNAGPLAMMILWLATRRTALRGKA